VERIEIAAEVVAAGLSVLSVKASMPSPAGKQNKFKTTVSARRHSVQSRATNRNPDLKILRYRNYESNE